MNRKPPAGDNAQKPTQPLPQFAKDSAEQIWQAGLGAFSKAQQEGGKVFHSLVQDGMALQKQAQAMAQEQLKDASTQINSLASRVTSRAAEPLDKLEGLFEQRVAKAMQRLGVPTAQDLQRLQDQIEALTQELQQARQASGAGDGAAPPKRSPRGSDSKGTS